MADCCLDVQCNDMAAATDQLLDISVINSLVVRMLRDVDISGGNGGV